MCLQKTVGGDPRYGMSQTTVGTATAKPFFSDGFFENPYPIYKRFLEEGPIHYLDFNGRKLWTVFSYAHCSTAIRDARFSARRAEGMLAALPAEHRSQYTEIVRLLNLWMLFIDAPEHSRLRKLMNKGFSPAVVECLRPQVELMVDRMLDPLQRDSEIDLMKQIAHPLPVSVIAEMLGIRAANQEDLLRKSDAIAAFMGNPSRTEAQARTAQDAILELTAYFGKVVAERRTRRGNDLVSLLLDIEEEGEVLTEEELYAQCIMLLFGGHETTRNLIGNGIYTLLRHPEQAAELRGNQELIRSAVEELLRYESPVQFSARVTREEVGICGAQLGRGETILFMNAAANRDPQRFQEPDRLDLKRANNSHLAFGAGAHFCIGSQLARLEGQVAIAKLLHKFPRMRLVKPKVEWLPNLGLRGLKELRVVL